MKYIPCNAFGQIQWFLAAFACCLSYVAVSNFCSREQIPDQNKILGRGWGVSCPKRAGVEHSVPFVEEEGSWSVNAQWNSFALNVGRWLSCPVCISESQDLCCNVVLLGDPFKTIESPALGLWYLIEGKISPKWELVSDQIKSARALRVGSKWAEASGKRSTLWRKARTSYFL